MRKKVYIGGILTDSEISIFLKKDIKYDFSAHNFQKKLLEGFTEPIIRINVPFFKYNKKMKWNKTEIFENDVKISEKKFINYPYVNNILKEVALKSLLKNINFDNTDIYCYSLHTPFMNIAKYIKKKHTNVKIVQIIPDLPQFMNLDTKVSKIYQILKSYDMKKIDKNLKYADLLVPFSKCMIEDYLHKYQANSYVMEGIYKSNHYKENTDSHIRTEKLKKVVYAGSLYEKYGVKKLVDAFEFIDDKTIRLVICGDGELRDVLEKNTRVDYLGMLSSEDVYTTMCNAEILINPREPEGIYTRYSFPSKIFDYLAMHKKVVCYKLASIPDEFDEFLLYLDPNATMPEEIAEQIKGYLKAEPPTNRGIDLFLDKKTAIIHVQNMNKLLK